MTAHPDYVVQRCAAPGYWRIVCRHCRQSWYLPQAERQRSKEYSSTLREHAAEHVSKGESTISEPLPFIDAQGNPTSEVGQSFWGRKARERFDAAYLALAPEQREQVARFLAVVAQNFGTASVKCDTRVAFAAVVLRTTRITELRRDTAAKGDAPPSRRDQNGQRTKQMAIGKRKADFMLTLKYNASEGTFHAMDRVQGNGAWVTESHDVTEDFCAVFDLENIETGWIMFPKEGGPRTVLAPPSEDIGDAPSKDYRQGVRVIVKLVDDEPREILSTSQAFWNGIDALHDAYLAGVEDHPGQLPVAVLKSVQVVETDINGKKGKSCTPIFEIIEWVPRPADMPKLLPPRPQPERKPDMSDAIPF